MLKVEETTDKYECYCNSCYVMDKAHYDQLKFYRFTYGSLNGSKSVTIFCDECLSKLYMVIGDLLKEEE